MRSLADCLRSSSAKLHKNAVKVRGGAESARPGDGGDLEVAGFQQLNGVLEAAFFDVSAETHAAMLVKSAGQMISRASNLPSEPDDREFGIGELGENPLPALSNQGGIF